MLKYYTLCSMHTNEEKRKPLSNMFLCLPSCSSSEVSQEHFVSSLCKGRSSIYFCHGVIHTPKHLNNLIGKGRSVLEKMRA